MRLTNPEAESEPRPGSSWRTIDKVFPYARMEKHMKAMDTSVGRRDFLKGALATGMAATAAAVASQDTLASIALAEEAGAAYADGTYSSVQTGMGGDFTISVTIAGGAISAVEVGENAETQGIGSKAIEQLPALIVEANGTKGVNGVSGASITSKAILTGVEDCLAQASGSAPEEPQAQTSGEIILNEDIYSNSKWSFEIPPDPIPEEEITETITADFLIIGAGTSGLVTGMAAAEDGVDICVIASSDKPVSRGGSNAAFNSRLQKELGREFPLEEAKAYFQEEFAAASWRLDQDKWWDFYYYSGEAMDWLMDKLLQPTASIPSSRTRTPTPTAT